MSINGMNKGYVGWSMSVRAQEAYDNGEMPKSKWTKSVIIEMMEYEGYDARIIAKAKATKLAKLRGDCLAYSSWHHTSKFCNETKFYALDSERNCAVWLFEADEYKALRKEKEIEEIERMKKIKGDRKDVVVIYDWNEITLYDRSKMRDLFVAEWATEEEVREAFKD